MALGFRWSDQFGLEGDALKRAAARYRRGRATALRWAKRRAQRDQRNTLEIQAWKRLEV